MMVCVGLWEPERADWGLEGVGLETGWKIRRAWKPAGPMAIPTFSDKLAHNSGTERARVLRKSAFDSSFDVLLLSCHEI